MQIVDDESAKKFIDFMELCESVVKNQNNAEVKYNYKKHGFDLYHFYDVNFAFVSDSIVINFSPKEFNEKLTDKLWYMHSANCLYIINIRIQSLIYVCMKEKGIFLRGGISNEFAKIHQNFILGSGVIGAYLAESKLAKYPVVVLDPLVLKDANLRKELKFLQDTMYGKHSFITRREDDVYYIDYLNCINAMVDTNQPGVGRWAKDDPVAFAENWLACKKFYLAHKTAIMEQLRKVACLADADLEKRKISEKYEWLLHYHNNRVKSFEYDCSEYLIDVTW
ncbi:hypothetical protein [Vogesella indigofera]|uniref:Uncharacterized protein n=1 Tax=Vogesella indigofera TaxID=45465 RepID=A0ABT5I0N6_VOGIN|nr:hypothetical protein [Vogesella indigofera]MDC7689577.1 hypothetical protein [Vogesella indigofera]